MGTPALLEEQAARRHPWRHAACSESPATATRRWPCMALNSKHRRCGAGEDHKDRRLCAGGLSGLGASLLGAGGWCSGSGPQTGLRYLRAEPPAPRRSAPVGLGR